MSSFFLSFFLVVFYCLNHLLNASAISAYYITERHEQVAVTPPKCSQQSNRIFAKISNAEQWIAEKGQKQVLKQYIMLSLEIIYANRLTLD